MADAPTAPEVTEQHTMAEAADKAAGQWKDDFTEEELSIPYKREASDEKGGDEPKTDADEKGDEAAGEELPDTGNEAEYTPPAPVVTAQDPGEYQPADYSFEVTLKDGKTQKVSTPEEAERLADDPDNFETPKQLMDFINKQNKMNQSLDRDKDRYDSAKKTFDEQTQVETDRLETVNSYASEFDYLSRKGLLPKVDTKYLDADWNDPEIAKQDGVKEQIQLLDYMVKENAIRAKAGVKPLTSIVDTFNAFQADPDNKAAEEERKAAGTARKTAGNRVAGVSPAQQTSVAPKGIAVGRVLSQRGNAMWDD